MTSLTGLTSSARFKPRNRKKCTGGLRLHLKRSSVYLMSDVYGILSTFPRSFFWSDVTILFSIDSPTMCSVFWCISDSNKPLGNSHPPPSNSNTHTFPLVAITNKVEMTQQEVYVGTGWRNPTGPSWKTATGTCGDGLVHECVVHKL